MILESVPSKILKNPLSWILLAHGEQLGMIYYGSKNIFSPFGWPKKIATRRAAYIKGAGRNQKKSRFNPFPYTWSERFLFFSFNRLRSGIKIILPNDTWPAIQIDPVRSPTFSSSFLLFFLLFFPSSLSPLHPSTTRKEQFSAKVFGKSFSLEKRS